MTAFPPVPADDWWRDGDETVVFCASETPGASKRPQVQEALDRAAGARTARSEGTPADTNHASKETR